MKSDIYFISLQMNMINAVAECSYISVIDAAFFLSVICFSLSLIKTLSDILQRSESIQYCSYEIHKQHDLCSKTN